ncbi:conserved hypothetical protein [Nostocoides japonicum T1-X7]|uniref:STAS domain-containing protein n=1 Tax=Nostocoides japonicum T1-X7 TaxID=1194083 RepID=A0A077LUE5_9MICO|nr:STAS domain-containing protein [Tetrasphaera japonica]CCH76232.1 conserved hypothetical protein [Tetrasphaera japonica T1-X7]
MTVQPTGRTAAIDVTVTTLAPGQRVVIDGRIDIHTVPDLRQLLRRIVDDSRGPLVIDLTDAVIGDATALGLLVESHRRCRRAGRHMVFENACDRAERLLRAVRLLPTPAALD